MNNQGIFHAIDQIRSPGGIASGIRKGVDDLLTEVHRLRTRLSEIEAKAAIVDWLEANDEYFDFGREYLFSNHDTPWPQELTNGSVIQCAKAIMKHKGLS